jgi:hypothetical protein
MEVEHSRMRDTKDDYFANALNPRFSRSLVFQDSQRKAKIREYPPSPNTKNVLAFISVFLFFAETL